MTSAAISRRARRGARPRRGDEREGAILDAARRLLDEGSLAELTVGRIAMAAGLPRSSLYFYFADKFEIFEVLLTEVFGQMASETERWLAGEEHHADAWLRASVAAAVTAGEANAGVIRAATDNRAHPTIERICRERFEQSVEQARLLIERDRRAGLAPTEGPSAGEIARALMLMSEWSIHDLVTSGGGEAAAEALIETLTVMWARGVGSQPAGAPSARAA